MVLRVNFRCGNATWNFHDKKSVSFRDQPTVRDLIGPRPIPRSETSKTGLSFRWRCLNSLGNERHSNSDLFKGEKERRKKGTNKTPPHLS